MEKLQRTVLAPEEIELRKKRSVLERLKDRLADREEEMADLHSELERFEAQYTMEVGRLYADFDEVEAQIAEEEARLVPDDQEIRRKAEELRRRAEESATRANDENLEGISFRLKPTAEAKKAYHDLAREIHPDLALDAAEKERRHGLMAKLNEAYSAGNQTLLDKLADDFRTSPEQVTGDSVGDHLIRAIRQISQVKHRFIELRREKVRAESSELFALHQQSLTELAEGRNMLKQMAERTKTHIKKSERRLINLRNVNKSAEDYVKEKFGMDISDFR